MGQTESGAQVACEHTVNAPDASGDRALRQLVEKWREEARRNVRRGVNMARVSTREYFGGVNYGLGQFTCADELDAVLAARVQEEETP